MAQVFLKELNNSKTFGVMTTHYNSIKALASELPRVENGSMQFNSTDLSPEYILNQGVPGSSYTYEVAQKVGVSTELISQARSLLNESTVAVDRLLVGIQKEKNDLSKKRELLSARLEELEQMKAKQDHKIQLLEDKVRRQSAMNEQQNAMITWGKKFQNLVTEYGAQGSKKGKEEVVGRFKVYAGERASQTAEDSQKKKSKYQKQKEKAIKKLTSTPAKVGDRVKLIGSRQPGLLVEIKKDQYLLSIGALSTWVTRDKFIPAQSLHGDQGTGKGKARGGTLVPEAVKNEAAEAAPKTKEEERAEKKLAKKSTKTSKKTQKVDKNTKKDSKKTQKEISEKPANPQKTSKEKLDEIASSTPLKKEPVKKSTGVAKPSLTTEQQYQVTPPVRKVGSEKAKAEQTEEEKKAATDADLEKLKAFFGKK